jgi:hypothetical protein
MCGLFFYLWGGRVPAAKSGVGRKPAESENMVAAIVSIAGISLPLQMKRIGAGMPLSTLA